LFCCPKECTWMGTKKAPRDTQIKKHQCFNYQYSKAWMPHTLAQQQPGSSWFNNSWKTLKARGTQAHFRFQFSSYDSPRGHTYSILLLFYFKVQAFAFTLLIESHTSNIVSRIITRVLWFPAAACQPSQNSPTYWIWVNIYIYLIHTSTVPVGKAIFKFWTISAALYPITLAIESGRVHSLIWLIALLVYFRGS